jgi:hypothetical protein
MDRHHANFRRLRSGWCLTCFAAGHKRNCSQRCKETGRSQRCPRQMHEQGLFSYAHRRRGRRKRVTATQRRVALRCVDTPFTQVRHALSPFHPRFGSGIEAALCMPEGWPGIGGSLSSVNLRKEALDVIVRQSCIRVADRLSPSQSSSY